MTRTELMNLAASLDNQGGLVVSERVATEAAALLRKLAELRPVAWQWQHDETGRIGFVDGWQLEVGWQQANPRLHVIAPLYQLSEALTDE